jgi:hypothetical protein
VGSEYCVRDMLEEVGVQEGADAGEGRVRLSGTYLPGSDLI